MIVNAVLSIGYPTATVRDQIEIDDEDLEGLSEEEKEDVIYKAIGEWANEYVEYWYE